MMDAYEGRVEFIVVDGPNNKPIRNSLDIHSYPKLAVWPPRSKNSHAVGVKYDGSRDFEEIKNWIIKEADKSEILPRVGGPIVSKKQINPIEIQSPTPVTNGTSDLAMLRQLLELTINEVSSLKGQTAQLLEMTQEKEPEPTDDFSVWVYFLVGLVGGAVSSMIFFTYLIRIGQFSKKMKKQDGQPIEMHEHKGYRWDKSA
jgi:hypothetical protein